MFDKKRRTSSVGRERVELERTMAFVLLGVAVVGSALAIGAIHLPVLALVALTVAAASVFTLVRTGAPWPIPAPSVLCLLLAAYTYLQAVPLPMGLLTWIAPDNADVWIRALKPIAEPAPGSAMGLSARLV